MPSGGVGELEPAGQPAENMRIATQFIEAAHLGMLDSEVGKEVTHRAAVVTDGIWVECRSWTRSHVQTGGPADVVVEGGAHDSSCCHRNWPEVLNHGTGVLFVNLLGVTCT